MVPQNSKMSNQGIITRHQSSSATQAEIYLREFQLQESTFDAHFEFFFSLSNIDFLFYFLSISLFEFIYLYY